MYGANSYPNVYCDVEKYLYINNALIVYLSVTAKLGFRSLIIWLSLKVNAVDFDMGFWPRQLTAAYR